MTQHRWEQWLWTCVFALPPLLLWLLLVQVIGVEGDTGAVEASRELLFFSLATCTLALSDLRNADAVIGRKGYESLNYLSILVIASAAAMYGEFLTVHSQHRLLSKIFSISIGIALLSFVVSTITQIFIHRGELNGPN